jgi:hypothetical protein
MLVKRRRLREDLVSREDSELVDEKFELYDPCLASEK